MMKNKYLAGLVTGVLLVVMAEMATADPIQWASSVGGNDHWYESIYVEKGVLWNNAVTMAQEAGGHLATVDSSSENDFLLGLVTDSKYWINKPEGDTNWGPWLGGYNDTNSGQWKWITGEDWTYHNFDIYWDSPGTPTAAHFHGVNQLESKWNDLNLNESVNGYLVEYETAPVPEPTTMLLFSTGIVGFVGSRFRGKK